MAECLICFESCEEKLSCCGQIAHKECICEWLSYKTTCPHCREVIGKDEDITKKLIDDQSIFEEFYLRTRRSSRTEEDVITLSDSSFGLDSYSTTNIFRYTSSDPGWTNTNTIRIPHNGDVISSMLIDSLSITHGGVTETYTSSGLYRMNLNNYIHNSLTTNNNISIQVSQTDTNTTEPKPRTENKNNKKMLKQKNERDQQRLKRAHKSKTFLKH